MGGAGALGWGWGGGALGPGGWVWYVWASDLGLGLGCLGPFTLKDKFESLICLYELWKEARADSKKQMKLHIGKTPGPKGI